MNAHSDAPAPTDAPLRVAVRLLEADRLSLGRAAELAGTSVRGLLDTLGHDLVPVVVEKSEEHEEVFA